MPPLPRPTRTTPCPLCQRRQQAGRLRLLADRVVATASPTSGTHPAEAARLPVVETWPRRRLVELADLDDEES